jgi:hypothetical protein
MLVVMRTLILGYFFSNAGISFVSYNAMNSGDA